MDKKDIEKLTDVAGFLQGWLAFKKPVPNDEVVRLHFDLLMEVIAKKNESLHIFSKTFYCADPDKTGNCFDRGFSQCEECKK